jgi:hypothetical protein
MSRGPAALTQADIARAIRAAKQAGAHALSLLFPTGGTIRIELAATGDKIPNSVEEEMEIVL